MVRLTKIYTKVGDAGQTMLGDGKMVAKHDLRVEAYGTVDEANAALGMAIADFPSAGGAGGPIEEIRSRLVAIQNDLFDVGADLCVPVEPGEQAGARLRIVPTQVERIEKAIDRYNEPLAALNSFILPGGTRPAAHLHLARTIVRRAERSVTALQQAEPQRCNPLAMIYLNRLSDLLFVLARVLNSSESGGAGDVLWKPGASR
ncbi:MAG: cob(I)yrinic acid a,c-diamide adenosyltransferase [Phycisphaerales bacterium]|nr:cob(I)yrinic acid a,c-diamide adenosyltransferase [Phycisphaerales bacterium]